jgi:hypothetical protein
VKFISIAVGKEIQRSEATTPSMNKGQKYIVHGFPVLQRSFVLFVSLETENIILFGVFFLLFSSGSTLEVI